MSRITYLYYCIIFNSQTELFNMLLMNLNLKLYLYSKFGKCIDDYEILST